MNNIYKLLIAFIFALLTTGCSLNKAGHILPEKKDETIVKSALIKDAITLKLINDYEEIFDLKDVIVYYGQTPFNPLEETLGKFIVSTNKYFNEQYIHYAQKGIEKNFLGIKYATYTDEALLAMLAEVYGMHLIVHDLKTNKLYNINFQTSDVILSKEMRHNIYNGFTDTQRYYEERDEDE